MLTIEMSEKSIKFGKKLKKSNFYKKKKLFKRDSIDVDKILISTKESYGIKNHINISEGMMIMVLLNPYL